MQAKKKYCALPPVFIKTAIVPAHRSAKVFSFFSPGSVLDPADCMKVQIKR
jgi:hypothetical protein